MTAVVVRYEACLDADWTGQGGAALFDHRELEAFGALAHGQQIVGGCSVRRQNRAARAFGTTRRVLLGVTALVAVPAAVLALAVGRILWIGVIFAIVPAFAFGYRTVAGASARPKRFDAIVTEHSLLLVDADGPDARQSVLHALPRSTITDVSASGSRLVMTSAGTRVRLLAEPADARGLAELLRS